MPNITSGSGVCGIAAHAAARFAGLLEANANPTTTSTVMGNFVLMPLILTLTRRKDMHGMERNTAPALTRVNPVS